MDVILIQDVDNLGGPVTVNDHGLITMQYLTNAEKAAIESCGVKIGSVYNSINPFGLTLVSKLSYTVPAP